MGKPTLFFSHTAKDKELVLAVREKLMRYTNGVLEIFQSSDGQSIPFGSNWVNKVEEGLKQTDIMFVFATENSVSSGWIYFEAGFAYSKGVQVVPIGIGVDVGSLRGPFHLLQGFNIISGDSLNNLITIVNQKFGYTFAPSFSEGDYVQTMECGGLTAGEASRFIQVIHNLTFEIEQKRDSSLDAPFLSPEAFLSAAEEWMTARKLEYSRYLGPTKLVLFVCGLKLEYNTGAAYTWTKTKLELSPYRIQESMPIFLELLELAGGVQENRLSLNFKEPFTLLNHPADMFALMSTEGEWSAYVQDMPGVFYYQGTDMRFSFDEVTAIKGKTSQYYLSVWLGKNPITGDDLIQLVSRLWEVGIIRERT